MKVNYKDTKPKIDQDARVFPSAVIAGDVTLEAKVNVWYNATIRGDMAPVLIKENTNIQDNAVVHTNTDLPTTIGRNVTVGHSAIVHAATVHDNALIGMGSIILDGAVIGEGSLVGAGAVVPPGKTVPPHSLVVGNPMKIVRELSKKEQDAIKENALEYLKLTANYEN
jgi:carbonic anhydrase/acetyltransferase-like protein (isoleucine patch superfamily)